MNKLHFIMFGIGISLVSINAHSQTNTFPTSGNVGIGTTSPSEKLHVYGSLIAGSATHNLLATYSEINDYTIVRFSATNAGDDNYLISYGSDHSSTPYQLAFKSNQGSNSSLGFYTNNNERIRISYNGYIGIGTDSPDQLLTVKGKIHSEEIIVDLNVPGPDYVFEPDYDLTTLAELEAFIQANKHLPEIPSGSQMKEEGIVLGEMNMLLLKKIEELTLYTIEQQKVIQEETNKNIDQQEVIEMLIKRIETLENEN